MKISSKGFKGLTTLVIIAFVINLFPCMNKKVFAASGNDSGSGVETVSGTFEMEGTNGAKANIPYIQELREVSGGYELKLTIDPAITYEAANTNRTKSTNGYFTAEITGDYLIEIIGGKGGGANILGYGRSGEAGHVYGVVHLNAGDTLFYSIGGNGYESLSTSGGGNGGAGNDDFVIVGTGGGYTAVYLFEDSDGTFDSYIDDNGKLVKTTIDEADRTSKVIMVAAGGGGGGARDNNAFSSRYADGGAGGNIDSSSVVVGEGVIFPGQNGKSSSTDTSYVGKGGSNTPGKSVTSKSAVFLGSASSEAGQSWADGGKGGVGSLRGGGGGAGYNGGSGGVMESPSSEYDVGGGGGGASFIKSGIKYNKTAFTEEEIDALLKSDDISNIQNLGENNGGIFHIKALNGNNQLIFLKNINLNLNVSDYFDVTIDIDKLSSGTGSYSDGTLTVSGIDLLDENLASKKFELTLKFTPKSGFAGGNDVPLFKSNEFTLDYLLDNSTPSNNKHVSIPAPDNCAYVNVPLANFGVTGKTIDFDSNSTEKPTVTAGDLIEADDAKTYHDSYNNTTEAWKYAFIKNVSGYQVGSYSGDSLSTALASAENPITETKKYDISFTVSPIIPEQEKAKARIGKAQDETTYSSIGTIRFIDVISGELNKDTTKDKKTLVYNDEDGTYTLKFESTITYGQLPTEKSGSTKKQPSSATNSDRIKTDSELDPGYYYVYIKGGDGGDGESSSLKDVIGGEGGKGAVLEGVVRVDSGCTLKWTEGAEGEKGTNGDTPGGKKPGKGGTGSTAKFGNIEISAGGGGGGGGAFTYISDYVFIVIPVYSGISGNAGGKAQENNSVSGTTYNDNINGKNGSEGQSKDQGGAGGLGGISVIPEEFTDYDNRLTLSDLSQDAQELAIKANKLEKRTNHGTVNKPSYNDKEGIVCVIPLQYFATEYELIPNTTYSFNTQISPYFDIVENGVTITQQGSALKTAPTITTTGNNVSISNFELNPTLTNTENGKITASTRISPITYTVEIKLKPKNGFLGGNDVPVLALDSDNHSTLITVSQSDYDGDGTKTTYSVKADETTDFANVKLNLDAIEEYLNPEDTSKEKPFTVSDIEYIIGFDSLDFSDICTGTEFAKGISTYCGDFVTITDVTKPDNFNANPTETQNPDFTFSVVPKDTPELAVVGTECEEYSLTKFAKIDVKTGVKFILENITVEGLDELMGEKDEPDITWDITNTYDYTCKLVPNKNYTLPQTVKISYKVTTGSGTDITSECTYDYVSGELIIPYYELKENSVIVEAHAVVPDEKYTVTYIYPSIKEIDGVKTFDEDNPVIIVDKGVLHDGETELTGYKAEETVYDLTKSDRIMSGVTSIEGKIGEDVIDVNLPITPGEIEGYDFKWNATVDDMLIDPETKLPTMKMPTQNIRVTGSYVPKSYTLTIKYLDFEDKTTVRHEEYSSLVKLSDDTYVSSLKYGDTYNVECPVVSGYKPVDEAGNSVSTVSGVIKENTEIIVYYKSTSGELIVNFSYEDGSKADDSVEISLYENDVFAIDLSNKANNTLNGSTNETFNKDFAMSYLKTGYDIYVNGTNTTAINGTMTSQGAIYNVKFIGMDVEVTFDSGVEGVSGPDNITVQYNNTLGYVKTDSSREYKPLPSLYRDGFEFIGWKDAAGQMVSENTKVESTTTINLLAVWESVDFTVTVNFVGRYKQNGMTMYKSEPIATSKKVTGNKTNTETIELPEIMGYTIGAEYIDLKNETDNKYYLEVTTNSNISQTIYYDLQKYSITIKYVDEYGNTIKDDMTDSVYFGDSYSYMSPSPDSEKLAKGPYDSVSQKSISGRMTVPDDGVGFVFTITYFKSEITPIISVVIKWEPLEFEYSRGEWNPETHSYGAGVFRPNGNEAPKISVNNTTDSNVNIKAELSFSVIKSYSGISAVISCPVMDTIVPGTTFSSTVNLSGRMDDNVEENKKLPVGSVLVKITRVSSPKSTPAP